MLRASDARLAPVLSASDARLAPVLSAGGTRLEPTETEWRSHCGGLEDYAQIRTWKPQHAGGLRGGQGENRFLLDWRGSEKGFRLPNAEGNPKKEGKER